MITKLYRFEAEALIGGKTRQVAWGGDTLAIRNVDSLEQAIEMLKVLGGHSQAGLLTLAERELDAFASLGGESAPVEVAAKREVTEAKKEFEASKAEIPAAAPPITKPQHPALGVDAKAAVEAVASEALNMDGFSGMTKLAEVVAELRKRGFNDYATILGACKKMASVGDVAPPLDQLAKTGNMGERLKVHCAGKGVPGVPA